MPPRGSPAPGGEDDEDGPDDADAVDAGFGLFDAAEKAQQW
ncbi:hypothetical protein AB0E96_19535 [Kitasatospora sp. NPDC036755]